MFTNEESEQLSCLYIVYNNIHEYITELVEKRIELDDIDFLKASIHTLEAVLESRQTLFKKVKERKDINSLVHFCQTGKFPDEVKQQGKN
jgi:hypothetical protein